LHVGLGLVEDAGELGQFPSDARETRLRLSDMIKRVASPPSMGIATAFDGGRRNTELFGERAKREPGGALQNDNVQSGRQESVDRSVIPQNSTGEAGSWGRHV
jgi:hypothetical protein